MNALTKIWATLKGFVKARYEAASQSYWGQRSWIQHTVQDARYDADASTRLELVRRHRYWVANSPLIQRIRSLFVQFSVGIEGLQCNPNSQNEDWNVTRAANYEDWSRSPELGSRLSMAQLHIQWAGALFDDGAVFILKTRDSFNKPKIQTIEAHRVATPSNKREQEGKTIFDGVEVDKYGKPTAYYVRDAFDLESFARVPADSLIHIYKARRPGMLREVPEGFSAMNTLHDMDDLHLLEMKAAKSASDVTNVIKTANGEFDSSAMRKARMNIGTQDANGNAATKSDPQYYQNTLGGRTVVLKTGEDMAQFQSNRPSVVMREYWDYLTGLICCGYNVPKLLVLPYSLQGTVTRADLDVCTNAFRLNFELVAAAVREIYEWHTEWAVKFDRSMDGETPADYLQSTIRPPRAPNVDIGYTAKALQIELQLGVKTVQDVFAERQQDWRSQLRQIAETVAYRNELAKEFGIKPEDISQIFDQPKAAPATDQQEEPVTA